MEGYVVGAASIAAVVLELAVFVDALRILFTRRRRRLRASQVRPWRPERKGRKDYTLTG
jgi:hypothetical protein